jgi:ribosomal protein L34E
VNALFQVIQNILRRKEQQARCPHCGRPLSAAQSQDEPDSTGDPDACYPDAPRCPSCGRPLSGDDTG